jgi:hypothetical protein
LKKEAKTLAHWRGRCGSVKAPNRQKFLLLFSKRSAFFLSMGQSQGSMVL